MARNLCHKTGGICSHSKMAGRRRPVRPLYLTGQTDLVKVLKMQNGLHHCVDLVETIKMHMWKVRFGLWMRDMASESSAPQADRSDRFTGAVRPFWAV